MQSKNIKIVADSSSDLFSLDSVCFESAPLKILTDEKEYVDNEALDLADMVDTLSHYKGKSSTSCPNINDWLKVFGDAEEIYCFTITATLSGSYNAAVLAKQEYEEAHPERKVFVLNTLSTGPEMALLIEKTKELILSGQDFENICKSVTEYSQNTGLIFMLESMQNLANNGRVSRIVAKAAGLLGIRVVGKASSKGDLEPLAKCRGVERALENIVFQLLSEGFKGGKIRITHCFNLSAAEKLATLLRSKFS
ncbi:MAG: DegV family protein, partial [Clostridia bacterium]|nr:DegV family protein [Clostridia bacterium]